MHDSLSQDHSPDFLPDLDSGAALRRIAMPENANANGDIFGGWLLSQMDLAAYGIARRRSQGQVATVALESMTFDRAVKIGDQVSCYAWLEKTGTSSMTVMVDTWIVRRDTREEFRVTKGRYTLVAVDDKGHKRPVPPLLPGHHFPPPPDLENFKPDATVGAAMHTIALPGGTNERGDVLGGWLLSEMDLAASGVAQRRANGRVCTVAIDAMKFLHPVHKGEQVSTYATIEKTGRSSITMKVEAYVRDFDLGTVEKVTEARFVFVAIDASGRPRPLPDCDMVPNAPAPCPPNP